MRVYPMKPSPFLPGTELPGLERGEWWAQPKVDGWHVVLGDRIWTRTQDITDWAGLAPLRGLLPFDPPLDGELTVAYLPRAAIPSLRRRTDLKPVVWVFDAIVPGAPFTRRLGIIRSIPRHPNLRVVPTVRVHSWGAILALLARFKHEGHEGLVLKKGSAPYIPGKGAEVVSPDLIKIK